MAEYVHSGEKIQASQYNALVDAIAGPTNATADQPFTQTKNGIVINGGLGRQTTKAASTVPAIFEVSYGNGYVGAGYSTYQQGDLDANRFNGIFLNIGNRDTLTTDGFILGNGVAARPVPILAILDPTSNAAALVVYNQALVDTIGTGKLPLCTADKDAGYAFVQVVDNGTTGKAHNGNFVLLVGDFTKLGGTSGSDIRTVSYINIRAAIRGINLYENCKDVRVVKSGVLWRNVVTTDVVGQNIPHLSYTVGTQYVDMLPDSYVNRENINEETVWSNSTMDVKLKSIAVVPPQQLGFTQLQSTNTFELYHFDKLSSDISSLDEIEEGELSSYDVLVKHKKPHPKTEDDPIYEGQAEADLQYISLSTIAGGNLTGDSQVAGIDLSSVVVSAYNGKNFIELHEFHKNNTKRVSDISSDNVDLLIRNPKDNARELQYLSLSSLSAALSSSSTVDSETNLQLSSIQHNEDNGSLELFDFDDSSTRDFGELSGSGNYDLVLRKYSSGRELPAEVDYLQLSTLTNALDVKTDTTKTNQQYQSLEEHSQDGERYFGLYDFQTPGYSRTLKVKLSYGATTYVVQSGSGTSSPDPKVQFITRDASGNPFVSYDNIAVTAPRISASDVDGIETILSGDFTVISTDLSVLSGDISDLSSQLSNYWKVKGTYNNNCYGQSIGDASKTLAIGLDSRQLYAKDGSTALHWNRRVAYDGNGTPAINWSDNGQYGARCLIHRQGMPTVDWLNMNLMGRANGTTVAWEDRSLKGAWTVDQGTNPGGAASLTVNGQLATTSTLKIGNTTLNETQLQQLLALLGP